MCSSGMRNVHRKQRLKPSDTDPPFMMRLVPGFLHCFSSGRQLPVPPALNAYIPTLRFFFYSLVTATL